ncbi:hypothetical protein, partial [Escherichia coli]|uniref:hypothetical protein n=1 Tax=Escherichia coli TaxID=562 RepID=UPI000D4D5FD7
TLAGQVADLSKVTPAEIAAAVAAQIDASALKGKVQAGLAADGSLFFQTIGLTDLGADGLAGGTGLDADTLVNAGGSN